MNSKRPREIQIWVGGEPFKSERLNISVIYGCVEKVFRTKLRYSKGPCVCNDNAIVFRDRCSFFTRFQGQRYFFSTAYYDYLFT